MKKNILIGSIGILIVLLGLLLFIIGKNTPPDGKRNNLKQQVTPVKNEIMNPTSSEESKNEQLEKEKEYTKIIENENQFFNDAINEEEIGLCDKIVQNQTLKQDCIDNVNLSLSKKKNEISYCMKIKDNVKVTNCKNLIYYDLAIKNMSSLYCNRIKDNSNLFQNCTTNIILTTIENKDQNGDTKICETLIGHNKEYCINMIKKSDDLKALRDAVEGNNSGDCSQISDQTLKNNCFDVLYLDSAVNSKDPILCQKIISSEKKTQCLDTIGRMQGENILKEALANNDINLCEKISEVNTKNNCTDSINIKKAYQERNINYCNKVIEKKQQEQCNSDLSLILKQK